MCPVLDAVTGCGEKLSPKGDGEFGGGSKLKSVSGRASLGKCRLNKDLKKVREPGRQVWKEHCG